MIHALTIDLFSCVVTDVVEKDSVNVSKLLREYGVYVPNRIIAGQILVNSGQLSYKGRRILNLKPVDEHQLKSSFFPSWQKLWSTPWEQRVLLQAIHYATSQGQFGPNVRFMPFEGVETIPPVINDMGVWVVKAVTKEELAGMIENFLTKAQDQYRLSAVLEIVKHYDLNVKSSNKEFTAMAAKEGIYPSEPVEFIRFLFYLITGSTLLIRNRNSRRLILKSEVDDEDVMKHILAFGLEKLSSRFLRFKWFFLLLKRRNRDVYAHTVNRLRRLAKRHHTPMKVPIINRVVELSQSMELDGYIPDMTKDQLVRAYKALSSRITAEKQGARVFQVRNGRKFVKPVKTGINRMLLSKYLDIVREEIFGRINLNNVAIIMDDGVDFALNASGKGSIGNIPAGTIWTAPGRLIAGVHWFNVGDRNTDLDLSFISDRKIGWDSDWESGVSGVAFSGDVTSAPRPRGAVEYILSADNAAGELNLQWFNYQEDEEVPFTLILGSVVGNSALNMIQAIQGQNEDPNPDRIIDHVSLRIPMRIGKTLSLGTINGNTFTFGSGSAAETKGNGYAVGVPNKYIPAIAQAEKDNAKATLTIRELVSSRVIYSRPEHVPDGMEIIDLRLKHVSASALDNLWR